MRASFFSILLFIVFVTSIFSSSAYPSETEKLSKGQSVYVPAYSHIYAGNREIPIFLTVTVSIRNIDQKHSIKLTSVDYYDTQGKLLKKFLDRPVTIKPLGSTRYIIPQKDKAGGSEAKFIITWESDKLVNAPIVETVMIGAESNQGISFTSRGQVITTTE